MTEKTAGQVAYEYRKAAERRRFPARLFIAWDRLPPAERADEEAAAQAAIKAARPKPDDTDGRAAYEAYRSQSAGRSLVSGDPLPEWDTLPYKIKLAWGYAALEGSLAATGSLAEQILENAGDEWDGDEAIEAIAVSYVRYLEGQVIRS